MSKDHLELFTLHRFGKAYGWSEEVVENTSDRTIRNLHLLLDSEAEMEQKVIEDAKKKSKVR